MSCLSCPSAHGGIVDCVITCNEKVNTGKCLSSISRSIPFFFISSLSSLSSLLSREIVILSLLFHLSHHFQPPFLVFLFVISEKCLSSVSCIIFLIIFGLFVLSFPLRYHRENVYPLSAVPSLPSFPASLSYLPLCYCWENTRVLC